MNLLQDKPTLIKLGISAVIIFIAVYLYFDLSPNHKNQISVASSSFSFGTSPTAPISADNPIDPKSPKNYVIYEFSDYTGTLQIREYTNLPSSPLQVIFTPSRESQNNQMPITAEIMSVHDPAQQALLRAYLQGYATAGVQNGVRRMAGLLRRTGLTADEARKINDLNQKVSDDLSTLELKLQQGLMNTEELSQIKQTLGVYLNAPGDPQSSSAKADLARNVMAAGKAYGEDYNNEKMTILTGYLNNVTDMLTNNQKNALVQSIQPWLDRNKLN